MWPCCLVGSIRMFHSPCSVSLLILRSLDDLDVQSTQPGWPWQIAERKQKHGNWVAFVSQFQMGRRVFTWNLYRPLSGLWKLHRSWHPPVKTRHSYWMFYWVPLRKTAIKTLRVVNPMLTNDACTNWCVMWQAMQTSRKISSEQVKNVFSFPSFLFFFCCLMTKFKDSTSRKRRS